MKNSYKVFMFILVLSVVITACGKNVTQDVNRDLIGSDKENLAQEVGGMQDSNVNSMDDLEKVEEPDEFNNYEEITSENYRLIGLITDGLFYYQKELNGGYGIMNSSGEEITAPQYGLLQYFSDDLIKVQYMGGSKWGLIDVTGKSVLPINYMQISAFYDGFAAVGLENKSYGSEDKYNFIDTEGSVLVNGTFPKEVGSFSKLQFNEGLAAYEYYNFNKIVSGNYPILWGFVDSKGDKITEPIYLKTGKFSEGLAVVSTGFERDKRSIRFGVIDRTGTEVIPCTLTYSAILDFSEGLAAFKDGAWGFMDKEGREVLPPRYHDVTRFEDGIALVSIRQDDKIMWTAIDKEGKELVPMNIQTYIPLGEDTLMTNGPSGKLAIVNIGGNLIELDYRVIESFSDGLASVRTYADDPEDFDDFGFIDRNGNEVIPTMYEDVLDFSDGLAPVKLDGKWGIIDKSNKIVVPFQYNDIYYLGKGFYSVYTADSDRVLIKVDDVVLESSM